MQLSGNRPMVRGMVGSGSSSSAIVSSSSSPSSSSSSTTSRSSIFIVVLILIIIGQYVYFSFGVGNHSDPIAVPPDSSKSHRPSSSSSSSSSSHLSPALRSIHAARIQASNDNRLESAEEAATAIQLIEKFIRERKDSLDAKETIKMTKKKQREMIHVHGHGEEGEEEDGGSQVPVGAGPKLGAHDHADGSADDSDDGHHDHHPGDSHSEEVLLSKDLYHEIWLNVSSVWATDVLSPEHHHRRDPAEQSRHDQCNEWLQKYKVRVDVSWGELPEEYKSKFDELRCSDMLSLEQVANYIQSHEEEYNSVMPVPEDRQHVKAEPGFEDKVIAVVVCMTTRGVQVNRPEDLALFQNLLPTFVTTADEGFEYWIYIGYDQGDAWLDNPSHLDSMRSWFDEHVAKVLSQRGIVAKIVFSTFDNVSKHPGPAFNFVTGVAYADGATWIYRINDDIRFDTPWARAFVSAEESMGPPYGVVGPQCGQGATHILVVDFTHRTHHEIFPTHYPPTLATWWMDDWISQVYGRQRTQRIHSTRITHLTASHGTRYDGMFEMGGYMRGEIIRGRYVFEEYLSHTAGMSAQLAAYRSDIFTYNLRR